MSEIDDFTRYLRTGDPGNLEPAPSSPVAFVGVIHTAAEYRQLASKYRHQSDVLLSSADECDRRAEEIEARTRESNQSKLEHNDTKGRILC